MSADISFLDLFLEASLIVQAVMVILLLTSVVTWSMIFQRTQVLGSAERELRNFENKFWSGMDLSRLYQETNPRKDLQGLGAIFCSGFKEFARLRKASDSSDTMMEGSSRAMRVALSRDIDALESHLSFLATAGSISPYIGLFGTVWGIMNAFLALGEVQQATLNMVAPGIAEALIATAMGLFAAIPAVIAYNRFSNKVEKLENSYANFMEEFSSILHRQAIRTTDSVGKE